MVKITIFGSRKNKVVKPHANNGLIVFLLSAKIFQFQKDYVFVAHFLYYLYLSDRLGSPTSKLYIVTKI